MLGIHISIIGVFCLLSACAIKCVVRDDIREASLWVLLLVVSLASLGAGLVVVGFALEMLGVGAYG